jgi:hypothetical protein
MIIMISFAVYYIKEYWKAKVKFQGFLKFSVFLHPPMRILLVGGHILC